MNTYKMGRSLYFFVIQKHMSHDKSKPVCLNLECELDEYDIKEMLYSYEYGSETNANILQQEINTPNNTTLEDRKQIHERKQHIMQKYLFGSDEHQEEIWCPKCKVFTQELYGSTFILDMRNVSHSYSNSIWESQFKIL